MNRKNTILLAVLINAGLLLILFITALTSPTDLSIAPTHELSGSTKPEASPLFSDELDLRMSSAPLAAAQELPQINPVTNSNSSAPVHSLPPVSSTAEISQSPPAPVIMQPVSTSAGAGEVIVKKGDTLEKIAKANKTTVDEIIKLNHLPSSFLRVGQVLKLPAEKQTIHTSAKPATAESTPDYYTVKVGDNPWTIAMKNHIKVEELLKMNGLNDERARKLKAGDRLRIR